MSYKVLADRATGVFALVVEQENTVRPGAILIKGPRRISAIQPSRRDPIYFAALMLWAYFAGLDAAKETSKDERLPDYVRECLKSAERLEEFFGDKIMAADTAAPVEEGTCH